MEAFTQVHCFWDDQCQVLYATVRCECMQAKGPSLSQVSRFEHPLGVSWLSSKFGVELSLLHSHA